MAMMSLGDKCFQLHYDLMGPASHMQPITDRNTIMREERDGERDRREGKEGGERREEDVSMRPSPQDILCILIVYSQLKSVELTEVSLFTLFSILLRIQQ
jgi:hypothetical protein